MLGVPVAVGLGVDGPPSLVKDMEGRGRDGISEGHRSPTGHLGLTRTRTRQHGYGFTRGNHAGLGTRHTVSLRP